MIRDRWHHAGNESVVGLPDHGELMTHEKNTLRFLTTALVLACAPAALAQGPAPVVAPAVDANATVTPLPAAPTVRPSDTDTVTLFQSIHPNRPLLFIGGAMFVGTYATSAVLTASNTENGGGDKTMYLPVVGPWLHLKDIDESTSDAIFIAGSGILQGVGLGMVIASLVVPEKIPAATIQAGRMKMNLTATSYGKGSGGVGAVGSF